MFSTPSSDSRPPVTRTKETIGRYGSVIELFVYTSLRRASSAPDRRRRGVIEKDCHTATRLVKRVFCRLHFFRIVHARACSINSTMTSDNRAPSEPDRIIESSLARRNPLNVDRRAKKKKPIYFLRARRVIASRRAALPAASLDFVHTETAVVHSFTSHHLLNNASIIIQHGPLLLSWSHTNDVSPCLVTITVSRAILSRHDHGIIFDTAHTFDIY